MMLFYVDGLIVGVADRLMDWLVDGWIDRPKKVHEGI